VYTSLAQIIQGINKFTIVDLSVSLRTERRRTFNLRARLI